MKEGNVYRVLCLDGGGYLGTATAAFLRGLEHHFEVTCQEKFDLFVGTSTGGIIAAALASGMTADQVVSLYADLGRSVFPTRTRVGRWLRSIRRVCKPKYSNVQLRDALTKAFGDLTLGDIRARGKCLAIPAFNAQHGTPRIFKTDHSPLLTNDSAIKVVDVALATSAAPTYFPLAPVTNPRDGTTEFFVDGGVFANNPALIGIAEALQYLDKAPENVRVLSVSTPRGDQRLFTARLRRGGGFLSWFTALPTLLIDSPSDITDRAAEILSRRLGMTYQRIKLKQPRKPLDIDQADDAATNELLSIGADQARNNHCRAKLRCFFT